jgi:predicted nucleic acid-binding protein
MCSVAPSFALACAVGAGADPIVTGDKDLLGLKSFEGIAILSVRGGAGEIGNSG